MSLSTKRQDKSDDARRAAVVVAAAPAAPGGAVPAAVDTGYLAELQAQVWAMEPRRLEAFLTIVTQGAKAVFTQIEAKRGEPQMRIEGRTAVIAVHGILMREIPWWFAWLGLEGTSYGDIRRQVLEAQASGAVDEILLDVNSPGGAVGGITEAVGALFKVRGEKTLRARIDEMGASAAYWLASTAQKIVAEPNAQVGSIGVYTVLVDSSARAAKEGFIVHVIRGGDLKGAGIAGAPISEEQLANHREVIEDLRGNFINDVAEGRGVATERVREWATGAIWVAARAQQLGLINGVLERKQERATERAIAMEQEKDQQNERPDVEGLQAEAMAGGRAEEQAKLKSFREAFPDDLEYALASYDSGVTLAQAQQMYELQTKRLKAAAEQIETEDKGAKTEGSEAVTYADSDAGVTGDHEDFLTQARRRAEARNIPMTQAMQELAREQPKLHEAYLEQCDHQVRPTAGQGVTRIQR